jgi:drug/metabolite transporter (DMT)-like permease
VRADSLTLVLISCCLHAWWNFVLKRSQGGQTLIGWSKLAEATVFFPVFVWIAMTRPFSWQTLIPFAVVAAVLTGLNYVFLGLGYSKGDFSLVYPLSRGGILFFLPLLAWTWTGQRITALGAVGIALVVAGSFLLQVRRGARFQLSEVLRNPGNAFALLAALMAACYTLWDQRAVHRLPAFIYFYAYTVLNAAGYALWLRAKGNLQFGYFKQRWSPILQVGVFNTIAYLLVLVALATSNPSYVIAVRLLSIAIGAVLGITLLREEDNWYKRIGTVVLVAGCVLVSAAR